MERAAVAEPVEQLTPRPPARQPPMSGPHAIRALQRAVGNRAVSTLVQERHASLPPARKPAPVQEKAPQRQLQRVPIWRPRRPDWAEKDPAQPWEDCQPILHPAVALSVWQTTTAAILAAIWRMCGDCPGEVARVYAAYFAATGFPRFHWSERSDGLTCPIRSLKGDPDHEPYEEPAVQAVRSNLARLVPRLRGLPSVRLSLTDAGVPRSLLHAPPSIGCTTGAPTSPACLWLSHNNRFGGLLFGKGHEKWSIVDSEYGYDTRDVDGTVELFKVPDPTNPANIKIRMEFRFDWHLVDAVDFCPGNTVPHSWIQHYPLVAASALEASGMARDIRIEAEYTREQIRGPVGSFPSPDPPAPTPTHTLPAGALFDSDSDRPKPGAVAAIHTALGPSGTTFSLDRDVEVVGHADSSGSDEHNMDLSVRRAVAVKRILEAEYPSLRGHINATGLGESSPIASNATTTGRAANRRVEITVVTH